METIPRRAIPTITVTRLTSELVCSFSIKGLSIESYWSLNSRLATTGCHVQISESHTGYLSRCEAAAALTTAATLAAD